MRDDVGMNTTITWQIWKLRNGQLIPEDSGLITTLREDVNDFVTELCQRSHARIIVTIARRDSVHTMLHTFGQEWTTHTTPW